VTQAERASGAPRASAGGDMLTLTFRSTLGDAPAQTRAASFRFCADGTLRANGNSVAATLVDDCWRLGQRLFRDFDCPGPVYLRARRAPGAAPVAMGPYNLIRSIGGVVYADDACLDISLPALRRGSAGAWHEISLLSKMIA
jgi:hypothetical protein